MAQRGEWWAVLIGVVVVCVLSLGAPTSASADWPGGVTRIAVPTSRIVGHDVYGTAVAAAKTAYPGFSGVSHVVIASGDPDALSDAAVASSLCWVYDAPLLLVGRTSIPAATREALQAIGSANATVTVHVVGSTADVAAGCLAQIRSAVPSATVEQPWSVASHYSLAADVARTVRAVAAEKGSVVPSVTLVANGSDPTRFWDVAAASAVSRRTGIPILLTAAKSVPPSTVSQLAAAPSRVIVVGGVATVSSALYTKLGASERWGGASRHATAVSVASHAIANGYSSVAPMGFAATIPNAIVGAQLVGGKGGVLLYSDRERLNRSSWAFLAPRASTLATAYVCGGASIAESVVSELSGGAAKPWFASGAPGRYVGRKFRVTGWAGGNTTSVAIYVHGRKARSLAVQPWGKFNFTSVSMPVSSARVSVIAENPDGPSARTSRDVRRLKYPSATCIVIDKSDFKLYWVKDNRLVRAYPIAIGRNHMETPAPATWKILAKYHTSPGSVYGPRKMRLFRLRGGHYVFTRYGIHGTNQPWVIGTKASHGCIRMYNRDALDVFPRIPLGTMVYTRP